MQIFHISRSGQKSDITDLLIRTTWSGDIKEVARKLEVSVAVNTNDPYFPKLYMDLGEMLVLFDDTGKELWRGYIFAKSKSLTGTETAYTAYDGLIYLTKSKISKNFKSMTAEQITKLLCTEFGVPTGQLAATNKPQSFVHHAKTVYEAIMTGYTLASHSTNRKYMPRMREGKLDVVLLGGQVAKRILTAETDLLESTYDESIDAMVNRVLIVNDKGGLEKIVEQELWRKNYGLLQDVYQREQGKDANQEARSKLYGMDRCVSVQVLGGKDAYDLVAGNAVQMIEHVTGLTGLFYIENDAHSFENGTHTLNLRLNFESVMDTYEPEAQGV
ncbi:hypothetical protein BVG16_05625 [Paenibacillus selenitireducens]|uniref:YqbQ/XkdQ domain-containing protein n=1 Tax=Paenibacillus selenitireducens TaxID=1324314 RepID=A0A1T2XKL1_9BACL|nr:hypothetical protein [Paenibacillus selenitireducens]OPA80223.1 hypothetical protein BVG16_05625 [Paenibacillus selenitireducens]